MALQKSELSMKPQAASDQEQGPNAHSFQALPTEIHIEILNYLGPASSTCLGLTCKQLYPLHRENYGTVKLTNAGNFVTDYLCDNSSHTSVFDTSEHPFDCDAFAILQAMIHKWIGPSYIFTLYGKYELEENWERRQLHFIDDVRKFQFY